ncbi:hypothetical protein VN97_g7532, partial [Penicillium thymicola]|jgi:hypothetical protein
MGST